MGAMNRTPTAASMYPTLPDMFGATVLTHPDNARILVWLGVATDTPAEQVTGWVDSGWDEAGQALWFDVGQHVPGVAPIAISYHMLLVRIADGLVLAATRGRCTFVVRRASADPPRKDRVETLDGTMDLSALEPRWAHWWLDPDWDDPIEVLRDALAG